MWLSISNRWLEDTDIPYQSLINLYLQDCVATHRKLNLQWESLIPR